MSNVIHMHKADLSANTPFTIKAVELMLSNAITVTEIGGIMPADLYELETVLAGMPANEFNDLFTNPQAPLIIADVVYPLGYIAGHDLLKVYETQL